MKYSKRIKNKVVSIKYLMGIVVLLILYTYFLILNIQLVHAENVGLKVAPSLLQLKVRPPTEINAPITVENLSSNVVDLQPQFKLFKAGAKANGEVEYLEDSKNKTDFFSTIRLTEADQAVNNLTLGANQKKQLNLNIPVPTDLSKQDIYFSLIFVATPKSTINDNSSEKTSFVKINSGVAMNVILSVNDAELAGAGAAKPDADLELFEAPSYIEKGPVPFTVKIKNKSRQYITPKGSITIKNMFGQVFEKVELQSSTILADSSRYLTNSNSGSNPESNRVQPDINISSPNVIWPEKFLLGFYEAQLKVEVSPGGEILTQTVRFAAFPIRLSIGLIAGILLLLIIYKRLKAKMNER
jgi:hypothetical protein